MDNDLGVFFFVWDCMGLVVMVAAAAVVGGLGILIYMVKLSKKGHNLRDSIQLNIYIRKRFL